MGTEARAIGDRRHAVGRNARAVAGYAVADRFGVRNRLAEDSPMRLRHRLDYILAFGDLVTVGGEIEIDANVQNIAFPFFNSFANSFNVTFDRQRSRARKRLHNNVNLSRRARAGFKRVTAVDGTDLNGRQHELVRVFPLIFFLPILNRLSNLASSKHEFGRLAVDAHPRPNETRVTDLQMQARRLADDAHIGHDAVIHQVACANTRSAVGLAVEPADLRLFDLADDAGNNQIPFELDSGLLQRCYRFDVAWKRRFHVDQAAPIDPVLINNSLLGIVEVIHMRVEHQRRTAAGPFQRADDIRPAVFDILILDLHAELFELAAEIPGDVLFLAGDAHDVSQIARHLHNTIAIHLSQNFFLH